MEDQGLLFTTVCEQRFAYLKDRFGFFLRETSCGTVSAAVLFTNATTGVRVCMDCRDHFIFLSLIKLIHGTVPPMREYPMQWLYFDLLLAALTPGLHVAQLNFGRPMTDDDVMTTVTTYARLVETCATGILQGNFALFDKVKYECRTMSTNLKER